MANPYIWKGNERGGVTPRLRVLHCSLADAPRGRCGGLEEWGSMILNVGQLV